MEECFYVERRILKIEPFRREKARGQVIKTEVNNKVKR